MGTATVERLDQRLCALEDLLASIDAKVSAMMTPEHAQLSPPPQSSRAHAATVLERILARCGTPPPPKRHPRELRIEMIANSVDPRENTFSRDIIRMREESTRRECVRQAGSCAYLPAPSFLASHHASHFSIGCALLAASPKAS